MTEGTYKRARYLGERLEKWEEVSRVLHCTVESGFKFQISLMYGRDSFNFLKFPEDMEGGVRAKLTAWVDEEIQKTKKEIEAL